MSPKQTNYLDLRVLVVDDHHLVRDVIGKMLQQLGIEHTVVGNGAEAINCICSNNYDLAIMDISMPAMDGLETSKEIRQLNSHQPIIIACTGGGRAISRKQLNDAGIDDILLKPTSFDNFKRLIDRISSRARNKPIALYRKRRTA